MNLTLPISGFASIVGLAAGGLPGHRVQAAPGIPFCGIQLPFLLFGELFVGYHGIILLDLRVLQQTPSGLSRQEITPDESA